MPDRSGRYRTSTASARSQWALPELNAKQTITQHWNVMVGIIRSKVICVVPNFSRERSCERTEQTVSNSVCPRKVRLWSRKDRDSLSRKDARITKPFPIGFRHSSGGVARRSGARRDSQGSREVPGTCRSARDGPREWAWVGWGQTWKWWFLDIAKMWSWRDSCFGRRRRTTDPIFGEPFNVVRSGRSS